MKKSRLLADYAAYNLWANELMVRWLQSKPAAVLQQETASSFPTLRATLLHIWGAQEIWLNRLNGFSPNSFLGNTFQGSDAEILEGLIHSSREWVEFVASKSSGRFFNQNLIYLHTSGKRYEQPADGIALHCLQHSTFHRGQIVTMARSLGLSDPPSTDYIKYVRMA